MARVASVAKASARDGEPAPLTRGEAGTRETTVRTVKIRGLTSIMFDRYPGDNDTRLEVWQKLYFGLDPEKSLVLPNLNIISALSAQNTDSWPKRLLDKRKYKDFCFACASYVTILPELIPFTRGGQPIVFDKFSARDGAGRELDPQSGVFVHRSTARLEKGIPNPKVRPVMPLPWELEFQLTLWRNKYIQEQQLMNVMTEGLLAIGLGTYRGQYGKGEIVRWE